MKKNIKHFLFCGLVICGSTVFGRVNGPVDMLSVIADGMESNLEKIRTWKGSADFSFSRTLEIEGMSSREEERQNVCFILSQDNKSIQSFQRIITGEQKRNGSVLNLDGYCRRIIIKDDISYERGLFKEDSNNIISRQVNIRFSKDMLQTIDGQVFNPREILKQMLEKHRLIERFRRVAKDPNIVLEDDLVSVSREGSLVTVHLTSPDRNKGIFGVIDKLCVFDASKGFSIVEFKVNNAIQKTTWKVDYAEFKGVFLPTEISHYFENIEKDRKFTFQGNAILKTEMLNEVVDPNEFTIEKIGLRKGDTVVDATQGSARYQWQADAAEIR